MSGDPQSFRHDESDYERPTRKWVCGRLADGLPCQLGPGPKGVCHASSECVPILKQGRWYCTRSSRGGGPCEDGPLPDGACPHHTRPCHPVLNSRARRRQWTMLASALTLGGLCVLLANDTSRRRFVDSGPLSANHAAYFRTRAESQAALASGRVPAGNPNDESDCGACHAVRDENLGEIVAHVFRSGNSPDQNTRCLECHRAALGGHALAAHSLANEVLNSVTANSVTGTKVAADGETVGIASTARRLLSTIRLPVKETVGCARCHAEHRGSPNLVDQIDEALCHSCHRVKFDSFPRDHPDFVDYPHQRRMPIYFDHAAHYGHRKGLASDTSCDTCHFVDQRGRTMRVRPFEETCAQCHSKLIAFCDGIPILNVPGFDTQTLAENDLSIEPWPRTARGAPTAFMRLLLAADEEQRQDLEKLSTLRDWSDLSGVDRGTLEAAQRTATAIKQLFQEAASGGAKSLSQRVKTQLASPESENFDVSRLVQGLSTDTLVAAVNQWFPVEAGEPSATTVPPAVASETAGWFRGRRGQQILYRPVGHADPVLRSWIDLTARHQAEAWAPAVFARLNDRDEGACLTCHTVDRAADGTLRVHWWSRRRESGGPRFTDFSHDPHVALASSANQGCQACHVMEQHAQPRDKARFRRFYMNVKGSCVVGTGDTPSGLRSNFRNINRQRCLTCHDGNAAPGNCLTCHGYHLARSSPRNDR